MEQFRDILSNNTILPASAGSGKTSYLVDFYIYLILEEKIVPKRLLAISYTNKSAYELKERIIEKILDGMRGKFTNEEQKDILHKIYDAQISTIHSFALSIIKKYPIEFGINPRIKIIEGYFENRNVVIEELIKKTLLQILKYSNTAKEKELQLNLKNVLEYIDWSNVCNYLKNIIDDPYLMYYEEMISDIKEDLKEETLFVQMLLLAKFIYEKWEEKFLYTGEIGYDDIENIFLSQIKRNKSLQEEISSLYDKVIVDEYQDISPIEYDILFRLWGSEGKLFVVGDVKQSIYSFRKADYRIFLATYKNFTNVLSERVENYRSSIKIISEVNDIFSRVFNQKDINSDTSIKYTESKAKLILSEEKEKKSGVFYIKLLYKQNERREKKIAEYIKGEIDKLTFLYKEDKSIAILSHKSNSFGDIANYLREIGVSSDSKENSYWDFLSIREIVLFLKALIYPDDYYLFALLMGPMVGLSLNETIYIKENFGLETIFVSDVDIKNVDIRKKKSLQAVISVYKDISQIYEFVPTYKVIEYIMQETALQSYIIEKKGEWEAYEYFLEEIYKESDAGFLPIWKVEKIARGNNFYREIEKRTIGLYTIHSAKGLEFDIVFLIDVELGRKAGRNNLAYVNFSQNNIKKLLYISDKLWKPEKNNTNLFKKYVKNGKQMLNNENINEIKRLLYVAYTRAKERLYIITTKQLDTNEQRQDNTKFQTILQKAKKIKWQEL